jgi:hypothetical protein
MKTAIVELDAGGRGSHGHRSTWSSMVQHVQHAGRCGNLRDHCWNMLDFAGLCGTMLDHAGPFAGHAA